MGVQGFGLKGLGFQVYALKVLLFFERLFPPA